MLSQLWKKIDCLLGTRGHSVPSLFQTTVFKKSLGAMLKSIEEQFPLERAGNYRRRLSLSCLTRRVIAGMKL